MRFPKILSFALISSMAIGGCSQEQEAPFRAPAPLGAELIQVDASSVARAKRVAAIEGPTIGEEGSKPLGLVREMDVDDQGRLFVLDDMASSVAVYDSMGTFIRSIGRPGEGPGELKTPFGVAVHGDTVFIADRRSLHLFDTTGVYKASEPGNSILAMSESITSAMAGLVVMKQEDRGDTGQRTFENERVFRTYDIRTHVLRPAARVRTLYRNYGRIGTYVSPLALSFGNVWALDESGRVYNSEGDSLHISIHSPDGNVVTSIIGYLPRVPTSEEDLKEYVGRFEQIDRVYFKRDKSRWKSYSGGPRLDVRPVIAAMVVSEEGTLFIKRADTSPKPYSSFDSAAQSEWLVLSPKGTPSATFTLPTAFEAKIARGCRLIGLWENEDGTPLIRRYDIPGCN